MAETRTHPESHPHHEESHKKQHEEKKHAEGKDDQPRGGNDPHNQQHLAHGANHSESTKKASTSRGSHSGGGGDDKDSVHGGEPSHSHPNPGGDGTTQHGG